MKILIIDDDKQLGSALKLFLKNQGFTVDYTFNAEQGLFFAKTNYYDCILLDYIMPNLNGEEVCKEIRLQQIDTPIIILSVKKTAPDKITLLNSGADHYLTKPFNLEELLATIKAITRRPANYEEQSNIEIGGLLINPTNFVVKKNDKEINLSPKEFDLLYLLTKNPNKVLSRQIILEKVWDRNADMFSNTVDVHIQKLRKKLKNFQQKDLIKTIPGRGYKITDQTS